MQSKMSKDSEQSHYVQALRYLSGTDFDQNFELALFHFRKAAIENHIEAQCNLGLMHSRGFVLLVSMIFQYKKQSRSSFGSWREDQMTTQA